VPPKVKILAWKLARDGLASNDIRKQHRLTRDATCQICGCEDETAYHAMVQCTKAFALRRELRQYWDLPDEQQLRPTGPDWLMLLLQSLDERRRARIILMPWHAWHLGNPLT
jgi:hypothetical protein